MNDKINTNHRPLARPLLAASLTALLIVVVMLAASSSQRASATASKSYIQRDAMAREHLSATLLPPAPPAGPLVEPCGPNSNYTYTITFGGTLASVTNLVPGSQCDECTVVVGLPFATQLYDGIFSTVTLGSNGTMGFVANANPPTNLCAINPAFNTAILPFHSNLTTAVSTCGPDCGWYMQTRTVGGEQVVDFKIRAYSLVNSEPVTAVVSLPQYLPLETEVGATGVYSPHGWIEVVSMPVYRSGTTIGVQRDLASGLYTQFACNTGTITGTIEITFSQIPCGTPTATPTIQSGTRTPTPPFLTRTPTRSTTPRPTNTPGGPTDTPAIPTGTPTACPIQFTDVPQGSTFYPYIRCLACRGIINGYPDGTFKPNNLVTRGQLSKIVANAAGWIDNIPANQWTFQDVLPQSIYWFYIERFILHVPGGIGGYQCGIPPAGPCVPPENRPYFLPNSNATRGQIAKIISNAAGFTEPVTGQTYQDVPFAYTFYDFIERLASRGVMAGYACGGAGEPCVPPENRPYFRPNNNATRGQTSKIVANTFFPACQTPLK